MPSSTLAGLGCYLILSRNMAVRPHLCGWGGQLLKRVVVLSTTVAQWMSALPQLCGVAEWS